VGETGAFLESKTLFARLLVVVVGGRKKV